MAKKRSLLYLVIPVLYIGVIGLFVYLQFFSVEPFSERIGNLSITVAHPGSQAPATTLIGVMEDQAALRGILCRLWDLNLTVVSVRRTEREEKDG